ncbi:type II secretion system F family protein [Chordicoccus furentiruminis]|uniref:type II secretion system F family protein n=1 Tax=Chordicoccus furentiruminis TaxID=2709410 RepID=UPI0023A907BA|nr:type II secretion system F family protein [Chordicoccus furentiruminis]
MKEAGGRTDYHTYRFSSMEKLKLFLSYGALSAAAGWLFYDSWIAALILTGLFPLYFRSAVRKAAAGRRRELSYDFRDALNSLTISIRAGRSVEHAFPEAARDLAMVKGREAPMTEELFWISGQLRMAVPVEKLLLDLSARSGVEDIENFASVFVAAKRMGGSLPDIIRKAAGCIEGKIDVEREIETNLSGKQLEQKIMTAMPAGIIFYMRAASPGYLDSMYGNLPGVLIMTGCLAGYLGAAVWGRRIVRIEV